MSSVNRTPSPSVSGSLTLSSRRDGYLSEDESAPGTPCSQRESSFDFSVLKEKNYTETKTTSQETKTGGNKTTENSDKVSPYVSFRTEIGTPKFSVPDTPEVPYTSFGDKPLRQRRISDPARTDLVSSNKPAPWDNPLPGRTEFDKAKTLERRSIYCFSLAFFALVSMVPAALFFPPLLSVLLSVVLIGGIGGIISYTLSGRLKEEFCSQLLEKISEKIRSHLSENERETYPFVGNKEALSWLFKRDAVLFLDFARKFWDLVAEGEGRVKDAVDYFESILTVLQEEKKTQEEKQELEQRQKQKEFSFSWLRLKEKFTFLLEDPKPDNVKQNEMRALKKAIGEWKVKDFFVL